MNLIYLAIVTIQTLLFSSFKKCVLVSFQLSLSKAPHLTSPQNLPLVKIRKLFITKPFLLIENLLFQHLLSPPCIRETNITFLRLLIKLFQRKEEQVVGALGNESPVFWRGRYLISWELGAHASLPCSNHGRWENCRNHDAMVNPGSLGLKHKL